MKHFVFGNKYLGDNKGCNFAVDDASFTSVTHTFTFRPQVVEISWTLLPKGILNCSTITQT